METQLLSERVQIERKQFFFDFRENANGRFLKITEEV
ncbi:MAG: DNA-binding protein, partial [Verrucomicrobia bacterium]|nr:DNA-binding protein [Verrucomicrobiota bacterium]